ncbi:nucleoside phosphorylase domain-containing protein [Aspergillus cavernicola]|uniref:Nucleoside phosphorylase domain-containing protein n=1 Tax=Aspergillus cavernicola TaxID=176166 RepID=A0ABR4J177_9EURO
MESHSLRPEDYRVGYVSTTSVELAAASEMRDEEHPELPYNPNDVNIYTLGQIGRHKVAIACLPSGQYGTNSAATVAIRMKSNFPATRFGLMVGVGGGAPGSADPSAEHGGIVQYDSRTATASGFQRKGFLNAPPLILLDALGKLRATHLRQNSKVSEHLAVLDRLPQFQRASAGPDKLFTPNIHSHLVVRAPRESPFIRSGIARDPFSAGLGNVLCFEMEVGDLMNGSPCVVIRGICDYSDTHKNKSCPGWITSAEGARVVVR